MTGAGTFALFLLSRAKHKRAMGGNEAESERVVRQHRRVRLPPRRHRSRDVPHDVVHPSGQCHGSHEILHRPGVEARGLIHIHRPDEAISASQLPNPEKDLRSYCRATARASKMQTGKPHRPWPPDALVADMIASGLVTPQPPTAAPPCA